MQTRWWLLPSACLCMNCREGAALVNLWSTRQADSRFMGDQRMTARRAWRVLTLGLGAALILVLVGCPMPTNRTPTANAGADQTATAGSTVTLDGSGSSDPGGRTLSYQWQQTGGSPTVTVTGANSAIATFTAPNQATTLTFQLTVNNGAGGTASDTTVVTVTSPVNQSPIADAGPDQTVTAGSTVNLNGSGSSDPDGDPLTFQWQQTGGTPTVNLSNANTATASFTAPNQAATLTFELTVNDGHGGTASDTVVITVTTTVVPKPLLYIANENGSTVTAYDITTAATVNGNIAPNANLAGGQTLLNKPEDLLIDKNGGLLVLDGGSIAITGYGNALDLGKINGNIAPARNVQGAATLMVNPDSLAISIANDLLFVSDEPSTVHVFANASTAAFNGNVAPLRNIASTDIKLPFGINFGANDELYVANFGNSTVAVFANASNLNGAVNASRVITSPAFASLFDVFIDHNDTMYVVNSAAGGNKINVFASAASRNGSVMPDSTLTVVGAVELVALTVDAAGNGFVVDRAGNAIYGYNNIATRNGAIAPDRTLKGANTLLMGPIGAFEHE